MMTRVDCGDTCHAILMHDLVNIDIDQAQVKLTPHNRGHLCTSDHCEK